ncbi:MAG: substrate-binding domain-containing protein [Gammaproteobacteria bacterium]|nr:substrate-binding domain-containing protein [Gammaproteobacteria bacterium]NNF24445.1 substrate-binding domain-containing protein [Paracoccaceae bacterium]
MLIESGHDRIGLLTLDSRMPAPQLRTLGYKDVLDAAGLSIDPELTVQAHDLGQERASARLIAASERLFRLPNPPTVICCGNNEMATRVYGILRSRGLRVRKDIPVAGFEDHRLIEESLFPPLTTVKLPYRKMGRLAACTLPHMNGGQASASSGPTLVAGHAVWRSSVTALNSVKRFTQGRNST